MPRLEISTRLNIIVYSDKEKGAHIFIYLYCNDICSNYFTLSSGENSTSFEFLLIFYTLLLCIVQCVMGGGEGSRPVVVIAHYIGYHSHCNV